MTPTSLFFFGSLRDPALLQIVLGRPVDDANVQTAEAPDKIALNFAEEAYPYLADRPGQSAAGVVLTGLTPIDLARVEYYEEAEYGLAPIRVETANGPVQTHYFLATDMLAQTDAPWDFAAWRAEERPVALEAAAELMALFGQVSAEDSVPLWHGIMIRARMRARAKAETPVTGRLRAKRGPTDVITERIDRPYMRYFAIEEHILRHRRFDGGLSPVIQRTALTSGDAVTVLPYDPATGQVMLIEQFRAPMHARGDACPWGIEVIAGRIDKETDAEACARREALEEGGLTLGPMETIARYYSSPGFAAEHLTSYVGQADLSDTGGVFGVAHEDEDIRAFTVPLDEALAAVASGEINNGPAILSLLWLQSNRVRLDTDWG
ncbi:MAG: NUDIX domain-containing protein [Pseudomonadota bacterium]